MSSAQNAQDNYSRQFQVISSIPRILSVLRSIHDKHTLLTVSIKESKRLYNTALLNINSEDGTITIDELHPADGHILLHKVKQLSAQTFLDGVEVNFNTVLQETGNKDGVGYSVLRLPEEIRYKQRREAYRVEVGAANEIPVSLITADSKSFDGLLFDISAGGVCLRYTPDKTLMKKLGADILDCIISLPGKKQLKCKLKICHSFRHQASDKIHIGCRFTQLDKLQHRNIERLVASLQRESRKKDSR